MILPNEIEKLKCEAADIYLCKYRYPHRVNDANREPMKPGLTEIDEHFKNGADWGFEQGVLHERKRAEKLVEVLEKCKIWFSSYGEVADIEIALEEYNRGGEA